MRTGVCHSVGTRHKHKPRERVFYGDITVFCGRKQSAKNIAPCDGRKKAWKMRVGTIVGPFSQENINIPACRKNRMFIYWRNSRYSGAFHSLRELQVIHSNFGETCWFHVSSVTVSRWDFCSPPELSGVWRATGGLTENSALPDLSFLGYYGELQAGPGAVAPAATRGIFSSNRGIRADDKKFVKTLGAPWFLRGRNSPSRGSDGETAGPGISTISSPCRWSRPSNWCSDAVWIRWLLSETKWRNVYCMRRRGKWDCSTSPTD